MKPFLGVILLAGLLTPLGGTAHRRTEEGNRLYGDEAYDDALRAYTEAQVAAPEAPELHYDIGNVLFRQGDYAGAAEAFSRALVSGPPTLVPASAYNLGNARFKQEQFAEAVEAYRRALGADPGDQDAKRNLELALRALKEKQDQEKKDGKGKSGSDSKQDREQPDKRKEQQAPEQPKDSRPSPDKSGNEKKPGEKEPQPSGSKNDPRGSAPAPGTMTPEEAKQLLDRLAGQEKENLKRQAQRAVRPREEKRTKDW